MSLQRMGVLFSIRTRDSLYFKGHIALVAILCCLMIVLNGNKLVTAFRCTLYITNRSPGEPIFNIILGTKLPQYKLKIINTG